MHSLQDHFIYYKLRVRKLWKEERKKWEDY